MTEKNNLSEILHRIPGTRVLCVGDVMLDRFVYGTIERISPEAPVPVLLAGQEKHMPGGAGNVAANIAALGAVPLLVAVAGDDAPGRELEKYMQDLGGGALVLAPGRPTTVKSRFVCGGQQVLRVDRETAEEISPAVEDAVIAHAASALKDAQAVILSDYKKGLLTSRVTAEIIALARQAGLPVVVDPKGRDFSRYRGASFVTPNRGELEAATGMKAGSDDAVRAACMKIIQASGIGAVLATRSAAGMSLVAENAAPLHLPAQAREVYDVSGAGDTVVAVFAAALAAGAAAESAALLANAAAGIVVGKAGTATASLSEIAAAAAGAAPGTGTKRAAPAAAAEQAARWRARGLKVGFTNGCFDLLHPGHLSTLRQARAACDRLVVAVNADESVRRLKGPTRPVQDENARAALLAALEMVDLVVVFAEDTPLELIRALRPDVLVKGGQYRLEEVVGYDVVMSCGGKVVRAEMEEGFSTTNTVARMAG